MAVGSAATDGCPFTLEDVGKRVVTSDGELVGDVTRVTDDTAFVTPAEDVLKGLGPCLYDAWKRCTPFVLEPRQVDRIDSTAIVLKSAKPSRAYSRS